MPSTMTAVKAAAILAFPFAYAADVNVFAGYEGYTNECTSCYSDKLTSAFSPIYVQGDNPLTTVCASGNDAIFRPCDKLCIDKHGHSFRQNKCVGSSQGAKRQATNVFSGYEGYTEECTSCYSNQLSSAFSPAYTAGDNPLTAVCASGNDAIFRPCDQLCYDQYGHTFRQNNCMGSVQGKVKRDTACEICWKSASQENGCLTPFVVSGNEYSLAQCLCQPGNIDAFHQKCDAVCTTGGMSPSQACGMVGMGKRDETTLSTSTTCTTVTVQPSTSCNSTTSLLVAPTSTSGLVIAANSTIPFATGTVGTIGTIGVTSTGLPTETAPINNGASALNKVGVTVACVVASLLFALA